MKTPASVSPGPPWHRRLSWWALVALTTAGLSSLGLASMGWGLTDPVSSEPWSHARKALQKTSEHEGLLDEEVLRAAERDVREAPFSRWLARQARQTGWLLLNDPGPQVRLCGDQWILREELEASPQALTYQLQRLDLVRKTAALLKSQGTALLVVMVPDKSRLANPEVCGRLRPVALEHRLEDWLNQLQGAGVPAISLESVLGGTKTDAITSTFWATDTHWNCAGAGRAARAVAATMVKQGFQQPRGPAPDPQPQDYEVFTGDLVRLAGLDQLPPAWRPPLEQGCAERWPSPAPPTLPHADDPLAALLEAPPPQGVVLVGTSFSRRGAFSDQLAHALRHPVASLARDGGGLSASMEAYVKQALRGEQAAWVVWEIPERLIATDDSTDPLEELERLVR